MRGKPDVLSTTALAQRLYRSSRTENGYPREAWALARRLAGYLRRPRVSPHEELAFSLEEGDRVGVSRFRCNTRGKLKDFVMLSIERVAIPDSIWDRLTQLAQAEFVEMGEVWRAKAGGSEGAKRCRAGGQCRTRRYT